MAIVVILFFTLASWAFKHWMFGTQRKNRRDYYRNVHLKSEAWQCKRYFVLKRDNWLCVYSRAKATQAHHTRYAKYNIGKEPIEWLVSVCNNCHEDLH